jgi:hypothetical protein
MKNLFKSLLLATVALLICAPSAFGQRKKIAVVTMYCDKYISTEGLSGGASMYAAIQSLSNDPNFDLTSVMQSFHDTFFNQFAPQFPFDLVPESEVVSNPDYLAYESAWGETKAEEDKSIFEKRFLTINGYKPLIETLGKGERSNQRRMLEIFGDKVDGIMFVNIDFRFSPKIAVGGMGSAGVEAFCRIKMWNKECEKVFKINEFATSKGSVAMVMGVPVMKAEELLPLCLDANSRLLEDLQKRMKKIVEKSAAKL